MSICLAVGIAKSDLLVKVAFARSLRSKGPLSPL